MSKTPRKASTDLEKISRYCAYQERSHGEVREKLRSLGIRDQQAEELITELITRGFLNEERFAKAYAGGKFRQLKWGRLKIIKGLEAKGVRTNCIRAGLSEIDQADYANTLRSLLNQRLASLPEDDPYVNRNKLARYAIQKGFEPEVVWPMVKSLIADY